MISQTAVLHNLLHAASHQQWTMLHNDKAPSVESAIYIVKKDVDHGWWILHVFPLVTTV